MREYHGGENIPTPARVCAVFCEDHFQFDSVGMRTLPCCEDNFIGPNYFKGPFKGLGCRVKVRHMFRYVNVIVKVKGCLYVCQFVPTRLTLYFRCLLSSQF